MKKLIYKTLGFVFVLFFFFITHCTLNIENCSAQWVQMSNVMDTNRSVYALASNGSTIFAGCYNTPIVGVYRSTNNGNNWVQTSLSYRDVKALAVKGDTILAGCYSFTDYGIYKSNDNGTNWSQTSMYNRSFYCFQINGNIIFAGSYGSGVYKSTDNGNSWVQTSLNNKSVYSLALDGNNILAGTAASGVYKSTDNGTSWNQTSLSSVSVYSLAVNLNSSTIYAGTSSSIYSSTDNGANWTQNIGLVGLIVNAIQLYGDNIFIGSGGNTVVVSTNNGASWFVSNEGFFNSSVTVYSLCISNNYIFAGTSAHSVYRRPLNQIITDIIPVSNQTPKEFSLSQNYPNPFNPVTKIKFDIAPLLRGVGGVFTTLKIFDILGKEISTLVNEQLNPGTYEVTFDGSNLPSGIYFYQLKSESFSETKKLTLLK